MVSVFESLLLLGIGLLGITITIFVLAVSLLGKAIRASAQEKQTAEESRKKDTDEQVKELQTELTVLSAKGKLDNKQIQQLQDSLQGLQNKQAAHTRRLRWIRLKPRLLTATGGVLIPSLFFITSIIATIGALYFLTIDQSNDTNNLFSATVLSLLIGIIWIAFVLKAIEEVTLTSDEVVFSRDKEMFVTALKEYDEARKPALLFLWKTQPPFQFPSDSSQTINFAVKVDKADFAENVHVSFYLPTGFSFPGQEPLIQDSSAGLLSGLQTGSVSFDEPLLAGTNWTSKVAIKAPAASGEFPGYWQLKGKGAKTQGGSFKIIVK